MLIHRGPNLCYRYWVIPVMFKISQSRDQNIDGIGGLVYLYSIFNMFYNKMGSDSLIIIVDAPK